MRQAPVPVAENLHLDVPRAPDQPFCIDAVVAESRFGIAFDCPVDPKAARQNISTGAADENMPHYLRKLNNQAQAPKPPLRRI